VYDGGPIPIAHSDPFGACLEIVGKARRSIREAAREQQGRQKQKEFA
jgi:hypothetical protein